MPNTEKLNLLESDVRQLELELRRLAQVWREMNELLLTVDSRVHELREEMSKRRLSQMQSARESERGE